MISCETSINCSKIIRDALTQPGASGSSSFSPSEPADLPAYVQLLETKRIHWNNVDRDLVRQAFDKFVKKKTPIKELSSVLKRDSSLRQHL